MKFDLISICNWIDGLNGTKHFANNFVSKDFLLNLTRVDRSPTVCYWATENWRTNICSHRKIPLIKEQNFLQNQPSDCWNWQEGFGNYSDGRCFSHKLRRSVGGGCKGKKVTSSEVGIGPERRFLCIGEKLLTVHLALLVSGKIAKLSSAHWPREFLYTGPKNLRMLSAT